MKRLFWIGCFFLMACAPEKKPTIFQAIDEGPQRGGACSRTYSPIPLLRDGLRPLPGPEALAPGTYTYQSSEVFVREEGAEGTFRAHFVEEMLELGLSSRKICSTSLELGKVIDAEFPSLREVVQTAEGQTYRPVTVFLLGEGNNVRLSRSDVGAPVSRSFQPVLQNWSDWRIYQTSSASFEVRMSTLDVDNGQFITKRMVVRFRRIP